MSMTTVDQQGVRRLSRAVLITVGPKGIGVPRLGGSVMRIDHAVLVLLQLLANPMNRPLADLASDAQLHANLPDRRLEHLLGVLAKEGLLLEVTQGEPAPPVSLADDEPSPLALADLGDASLELEAPLVLGLSDAGYEILDHSGDRAAVLDATRVCALAAFRSPMSPVEAYQMQRETLGPFALDEGSFALLVNRMKDAHLLHHPTMESLVREGTALGEALGLERRTGIDALIEVTERNWREELASRENDAATGRIDVVPITFNDMCPPLGLGVIMAYAAAHDGGALNEHYQFLRQWITSPVLLESVASKPSVFLFSNYLWSHSQCLEASARVKELHPGTVTIHGGPNTPKYRHDVEEYFATYPHVDVAVRGEGEATTAEILAALVGCIGGDRPDLSALADVPGLSFRDGDQIVHTPDRDRIAELDTVPSPYLNGMFDVFDEVAPHFAIIETNRGCPYGCTFCDWGSATLARIRKFDLDRVFAELEWCAHNGVRVASVADANFGIFERDVAIARKVVELNAEFGFPKMFAMNFAKNTAKHLQPIIEMLIDAGILTSGVLSLQSMDTDTLKTIARSNIKLEKYEALATQFRSARLPLHVDIMLGLPGQTPASFRDDLQQCIDREVAANIPATRLLVNSPMNAPEYRAEHGIDTKPGGLVLSTATFTRDDYRGMDVVRRLFYLFENFGVLRQVSRWARQETGIREIDLYERLLDETRAEEDRWPILAFTARSLPDVMAPPVSWARFIDELREYLVMGLGTPADDSLETVLAVQHALLPARRRTFPVTIDLPHDFAAWHQSMVEVKDAGHLHDWPDHTPHLREFPPATFTVDDPGQVSIYAMGQAADSYAYGFSWDLESPASRPSNFRRELLDSGALMLTRPPAPTKT